MPPYFLIFPLAPVGPARRVYGDQPAAEAAALVLAGQVGRKVAVAEPPVGFRMPKLVAAVHPPTKEAPR